MPKRDNNFGVLLDALLDNRFILASPDDVTEQIVKLAKRLSVEYLIISRQWPGMLHALTLDTKRLMAGEVFSRMWWDVGVSEMS